MNSATLSRLPSSTIASAHPLGRVAPLNSKAVRRLSAQPWASNVKFTSIPASDFRECSDPGFAKIVWGFSAAPAQLGSSVLSTETRAQATDPGSRAKFLRYWLFVSPGIRIIRRGALNLARRELAGTRDAA